MTAQAADDLRPQITEDLVLTGPGAALLTYWQERVQDRGLSPVEAAFLVSDVARQVQENRPQIERIANQARHLAQTRPNGQLTPDDLLFLSETAQPLGLSAEFVWHRWLPALLPVPSYRPHTTEEPVAKMPDNQSKTTIPAPIVDPSATIAPPAPVQPDELQLAWIDAEPAAPADTERPLEKSLWHSTGGIVLLASLLVGVLIWSMIRLAGQETPPPIATVSGPDTTIYTLGEVNPKPQFPGGKPKLDAFLKQNVKYPIHNQRISVSKKVRLQFVINKDGSIQGVRVRKTAGTPFDEEAIRVVETMPDWKPGRRKNRAVRTYYEVSVPFVAPPPKVESVVETPERKPFERPTPPPVASPDELFRSQGRGQFGEYQARYNGKYGLWLPENRWLIRPRYDDITVFRSGRATVMLGSETFQIDRYGSRVRE
jgi:TonB family protein